MVCPRCISSVESLLSRVNLSYKKVILGEVELADDISEKEKEFLNDELKSLGFELIDNRASVLIEKIKKAVMKFISSSEAGKKENLSAFIASEVNYEYTYISGLFSSMEGTTIEHYYINQRIEKVKELLVYDELSLSEIADKTGFSSIHHISSQFKKVTGLTPSHFKKIGLEKRKAIDNL
jgi:AraC-like DNA-binding protein